jgi:4'-phosphopantetheinyl transferase EntD
VRPDGAGQARPAGGTGPGGPGGRAPLAGRAERAWIARQAAAAPAVCWDRLLFSAKEAVGKLWYPLTGRWPEPGQLAVFPDPAGTFDVQVAGSRLTGRWLARGGLIVTAVTYGRFPP